MGAVADWVDGFKTRSGGVGLLDQLDHVRGRLIKAIISLFVGIGIGFFLVLKYKLQAVILAPIVPFLDGESLKFFSPLTPFYFALKVAIFLGVVIALPFILYQFWQVVRPLLRPEERTLAGSAVVGAGLLFVGGVVFCYILVLPLMFQFTMGFQPDSLRPAIGVDEYLKMTVRMVAAFGIAFELPIIILFGTLLGIVSPAYLAKKRRHAFAILIIVAALVTPPDVSSLIILMVPVWILYEISIVISRTVVARREPQLSSDEAGWAG